MSTACVGCVDPQKIENGEYRCTSQKYKEVYPVETKCHATCDEGFAGDHTIVCTGITHLDAQWEPPEKPQEVCVENRETDGE